MLIEKNQWATYDSKTGKWHGMVELLLNGTANFAISHATDIPIRRTVVDFTLPTSSFKYAAIFRKPSITTNKLALFKPFQPSLWVSVLAWCVTVALGLLVWQISFVRLEDAHSDAQHCCSPSVNDCVLNSIATTCLQSACLEEDDGVAWRSLAATAAIVSLILNTAYSGNLFTFLSLRESSGGSLDVLKSENYEFVLHNQSVFMLNRSIEVTYLSALFNAMKVNLKPWHYAGSLAVNFFVRVFVQTETSTLSLGSSYEEKCPEREVGAAVIRMDYQRVPSLSILSGTTLFP